MVVLSQPLSLRKRGTPGLPLHGVAPPEHASESAAKRLVPKANPVTTACLICLSWPPGAHG